MNLIKSTSLLLSAIHTADAGLRGTAAGGSRRQESMELATVSGGPYHQLDPSLQGPSHYKRHDAVAAPLQSPGGTIKIAPKQLGFNMQFAVIEFGIGGVRDLHW